VYTSLLAEPGNSSHLREWGDCRLQRAVMLVVRGEKIHIKQRQEKVKLCNKKSIAFLRAKAATTFSAS